MPNHSHGWGLIGLFGGLLFTLVSAWLGQQPALFAISVVLAAVGIVSGVILLALPKMKAVWKWLGEMRFQVIRVPRHTLAASDDDDIPFHDAARVAYEAAEAANVDDVTKMQYSDPNIPLEFFKYMFMSAGIPIYGARPPSTQSLEIPEMEHSSLRPTPDQSALSLIGHSKIPKYVDVTIKRRDMNSAITEYITSQGR